MNNIRTPRLRPLWIAVAMLGGASIAGCGSVSISGDAGTNNASSAIPFAQCMRSNGVPNFPDHPITPASGINIASPAYEHAQSACREYLPPSTPPPPTPESVREQLRLLAECMRANGVPNFPDPDANGNIQFPASSPIPESPAFQHAQDGPCKKYNGR
jgi:hypothetical protein